MFNYDATDVKPSGNFDPAPDGVYRLAIVKTEEKVSRNGNDMVNVEFEIDDIGEHFGKKVWHNVTFIPKGQKGAGMAVHFLKTIGEPFEGALQIDAINWIGKRCFAKLVTEMDSMGKSRNKIISILKEDQILPVKSSEPTMTSDQAIEKSNHHDDSVPF